MLLKLLSDTELVQFLIKLITGMGAIFFAYRQGKAKVKSDIKDEVLKEKDDAIQINNIVRNTEHDDLIDRVYGPKDPD